MSDGRTGNSNAANGARTAARTTAECANDFVPITPDDSNDLPGGPPRSIFVETGGTLAFVTSAGGSVSVVLPDAYVFPVACVARVKSTGTSIGNLFAMY